MAKVITDSQHYTDIAAAIRAKNGEETTYKPSEMAAAIEAIEGGKKVSGLSVYEYSGMFTITNDDGTMIRGSATFDENGLPTGLSDGNGNTVNFTAGYPTSAKDSDGNTATIVWG